MQDNPSQEKSSLKGNGKWGAKAASQLGVDSKIVETAVDTAREAYDTAMERGSEVLSNVNRKAAETVRRYPMQATIGGLILGFVLGAMFFRPSRD